MYRLLAALAAVIFLHGPAWAEYSDQYFEVPQGDRPDDVAVAPDGTVWYSRQRAGVAGSSTLQR